MSSTRCLTLSTDELRLLLEGIELSSVKRRARWRREAGCVWYTLIQSARYNHVCALPYLNDVLRQVPNIVPEYLRVGDAETAFDSLSAEQVHQLTNLLPCWLKDHPEHRSEERQRELEIENQRRRQRRRLRRRPLKV